MIFCIFFKFLTIYFNYIITPTILATPLRSNLTRRGSVEVISDVELTAVEGGIGDFTFKRKKTKTRRHNKSLTTIAFLSNKHSSTDSAEEHFQNVSF